MIRRIRKALTLVALLVMVTLIAGYWFVTDRTRVRQFVEQRLTRELGTRVTVGDARLSIFEGLRLDNIRVSAGSELASPIFEAKRLLITYDPRSLFHGDVAAERVVAVEPRVRLIEDIDKQRWNFQLLDHRGSMNSGSRPASGSKTLWLPEVLVRNARFDYAQIENGRESDVGTLHLEGQFTPDASGLYRFRVQSRGGNERAFPVAEGWLKSDQSAVSLTVNDLDFVDEIKSILPAQVRQFWNAHQLAGRLDEMRLNLFRKPDGHAGYNIVTDFTDVSLIVPPTRWMGPGDRERVRKWHDAYSNLSSPMLGGSAMTGRIVDSMVPEPMKLANVDARFVFTDEQIRIEKLLAHVDNNALLFTGHIDGYSPTAAIDLRVESPKGSRVVFPESPAFVPSMPWPVQEIYYRFRPVGTADVWLQVTRAAGAEYPTLAGELNVTDARFTFDRIPYPVERATGKLRFGNDPVTGREMLELVSITGRGDVNGPNAAAELNVHGTISPLDESAGADIHVSGRGVTAEPRLIESLPPLTRKAVLNFDAHHTGKLPIFNGDFDVDVFRAVGLGQPWTVITGLQVRNGAGVFKGFPYALTGVTGSLKIYDDHVDIASIKMPAGGGTAELSGAINWMRHDAKGEPLIQPDLAISTRGVPINDDLIEALPEGRRKSLKRLGIGGKLDIDGRIEASAPDSEDPTVDLKVKLTAGSARPPAVKVRVDDLKANVRINGDRVDVDSFDGTVAGAALSGTAWADGAGDAQRVSADATITALRAEAAPLEALPANAATAVRSLHAKGDVDLDVHYANEDDYRVTIRPRTLAVKPDLMPLPFDHVDGRVMVDPKTIRLEKITAKQGDSPLSLDGNIDPQTGDAEVSIAGRNLIIDKKFTKALPAVLADVANTLSLSGPVAIDCPKLVLRQPTTQPAKAAQTTFDATLWLQKAQADVAAELRGVVGSVALSGQVDGDTLQTLDGKVNIDDMTFAGRRVTRLSAGMSKNPGDDLLHLTDIMARVAGGQVAGQIDTVMNKRDPRFGLKLLVRGAKVAELTGDTKMDGALDASLDMEGRWDDPATRRGRGDLQVNGKEMVKIPVVFGLMQVANLSIPNSDPIRRAALRYSVEGQRIRMDQIDLRSTKSVMAGDGMIDFDKKSIELNLALSDSAADALPLVGDLIKTTRQELLRLRIRGSLADPTNRGQAFNVFDSKVDEVNQK